MKKGDLLATYGTLRRGQTKSLCRNPEVTFVREDYINGIMHGLGWFPGVNYIPGQFSKMNPNLITVDVFRIDDDRITGVLDMYEGHPDFFRRGHTTTLSGLAVWVYSYPHAMDEATIIPSGDWVDFNADKSLKSNRPEIEAAAPTEGKAAPDGH